MVARPTEIRPGRGPKAKVRWLGPLPIWASPGPAGLRLHDDSRALQPAILRFDHDDFMREFIATLTGEPGRLGEWLAQPETWRAPMATPKTSSAGAQPVSKVAFLYDKTRSETKAKKPRLPTAINLQPLKNLLRRQSAPAKTALDDEQLPLKLYQSSQKRHYLVTASLIAEEAGLPDCEPELSRQEKVSFVLRRLVPPTTEGQEESVTVPVEQWDEYAFVPGAGGNGWRRIGSRTAAAARTLIAGEEQLPLFPVSFTGSCGSTRRLLSGVIPVSRREQWVGAGLGGDAGSSVPAGSAGRSLASFLFQADVVAPWKLLLEQAEVKKAAANKTFTNFGSDATAKANDRKRLLRTARDEMQTGSWYVLLDFARFLAHHLPGLWQVFTGATAEATLDDGERQLLAVLRKTTLSWRLAFRMLSGKSEAEPLTEAEKGLRAVLQYQALDAVAAAGELSLDELQLAGAATIPSGTAPYRYPQLKWSLADALVAAAEAGQGLEAVETTLIRFSDLGAPLAVDRNWPAFLFPLADPDLTAPVPAVAGEALTGLSGLARQQAALDVLAGMVEALLPAGPGAEELVDTVPVGDPRDVWFVVRCVYERPQCGPLFPTLVSAPTQRFLMAPFFDPDAPARPVRIPMPLDISPAGLRKYQKNTGFVLSDMLCGKIKSIRKMTLADLVLSVLPWPFHKDLPEPGSGTCQEGGNSFGTICSLSIPIVTLCALILMMIIVALFDLFFRWIPYLFICLPIPGLKGKGK